MYMFNNHGQRSPGFWGLRDVPLVSEAVHAGNVAATPLKISASSIPNLPSAGGPTFTQVLPGTTAHAQLVATTRPWYKSPLGMLGIAIAVFVGYKLLIK
jgi:hypothetical protein